MFAPERGASTESVSAPFPSVERSMVESRWVLVTPPRESSRCINCLSYISHHKSLLLRQVIACDSNHANEKLIQARRRDLGVGGYLLALGANCAMYGRDTAFPRLFLGAWAGANLAPTAIACALADNCFDFDGEIGSPLSGPENINSP